MEVVQESLPKVQQTLNHTLKQVPEILGAGQRSLNNIVGNQDLQRVGGQAVETAGNVVSGVFSEEVLNSGSRVIESLLKATNDTAVLVTNSLLELADLAPLLGSVAKSVAQINAQEVADTFGTSFSCDFNCRDLEGESRDECEKIHCAQQQ